MRVQHHATHVLRAFHISLWRNMQRLSNGQHAEHVLRVVHVSLS